MVKRFASSTAGIPSACTAKWHRRRCAIRGRALSIELFKSVPPANIVNEQDLKNACERVSNAHQEMEEMVEQSQNGDNLLNLVTG